MKLKKIAAAVLAAAVLAATPAAGALLSPLSVTANAEDTLTEGDYSYTVNEDGETVTITEYSGTDTEVVIPGTLGGKNVTSIGETAFYGCRSLTSITIPNGVTTIGDNAFGVCTSLTSVTIPDNVTTIGNGAFGTCTSLTSVTIPDSVTTIGDGAFGECTLLEEITVGENNANYSSINGVLFNSDKSTLICYPAGKKDKSYIIPDSVTKIDDLAFCNCTSLTNITIPDGVTIIGDSAFYNCMSFTNITIPNSVTTIGDNAFWYCTSLTNVTIPNSVTTIGDGAFWNCTSLEKILVGESNANYSSINGVLFNSDKSELVCYPVGKKDASYTVPDSVTTIGDSSFQRSSLTSVTIPDSVTTIGDRAFQESSLTSITIPDSVTTIGDRAFQESSLTSITIPDSVITIGDYAFLKCSSLAIITIQNGVTSIGDGAFDECENIKDVYYGGSESQWKEISIDSYNDYLLNATIHFAKEDESEASEPTSSEPTSSEPENLQPGDYFVDGDLEYTVLKDGTLEIRGFAGDETKEIVIPETVKGKKVTSIGDAAFMDCTSLTSVTIPSSVTKIGGYAFSGCTSLETVNYSGRKSDWEAIEIDIENEPLISAEIKFAEQAVEIVDENTGVKTEVSTEDENLDGAEFEANPADHPTLWDLIRKIIEKAVDTIESVTEKAQKSLEEAAEAVKNGKGFAYDMGFKKNGKEVQPDKSVTVTVPVPDKFKNDIDKLNVYHLTNRGAVYVPSWIKDSSIMFKTNSFSPYVITTDKLEYAVADENTTVTPGDTDKNSGTSNGNDQAGTGIAIAIAPVVLACTAVAVASKKKK